jgi:signal recognition particle subunit SRP54
LIGKTAGKVELKKLGPVRYLAKFPGLDQSSIDCGGIDFESEINRMQGILDSMTLQERSWPVLMTVPKRCVRIAAGAGVKPAEVSRLFTRFRAMSDLMSRFERDRWRKV